MAARCLIWFRALICFPLDNSIHGSTVIAQFYSETKQCIFHGDCEIPNIYNKTSTGNIITQTHDDFYLKLEIGDLFANNNISNYYGKSYIHYLDNEIFTQFLNTYTKAELDSLFANIYLSDYYNKADMYLTVSNIYIYIYISNCYTKTEIDDIDNELSTLVLNTYTKSEVDTLLFNSSSQCFFSHITY